jgi:hypothetical protein
MGKRKVDDYLCDAAVKPYKRTLSKKVDDLTLTVAELASHSKKMESWLAQQVHNLANVNTENASARLSDRITHNQKETQRILTGLAERMDALEPKKSLFARLRRVLCFRRKQQSKESQTCYPLG